MLELAAPIGVIYAFSDWEPPADRDADRILQRLRRGTVAPGRAWAVRNSPNESIFKHQ
jgi:hypothetical protein